MTATFCGGDRVPIPDDLLVEIVQDGDNPMNWCCYGSVLNGPRGCYCWVPRYSRRQSKALKVEREPVDRTSPCEDCAYNPTSAEQHDDFDAEHLTDLTRGSDPFWCHQGIRFIVEWRHPETGLVVRAPGDAVGVPNTYEPPIVDGVPFKASGAPADRCFGWASRHRLERR